MHTLQWSEIKESNEINRKQMAHEYITITKRKKRSFDFGI